LTIFVSSTDSSVDSVPGYHFVFKMMNYIRIRDIYLLLIFIKIEVSHLFQKDLDLV
jgi:hypothetical protein